MSGAGGPAAVYTLFVVPERAGRLVRLRLSHGQLMRLACLALFLLGVVLLAAIEAIGQVDVRRRAAAETSLRLDLRARLMEVSREAAALAEAQGELAPRAARLAHLATPPGGSSGRAPMAAGEVLYAPFERIDEENEALESQLGQQLVAGAPAPKGALAAPAPVPAPADGVVVAVVPLGPGAGFRVDLAHPGHVVTRCAPLWAPAVREGQRLVAGEPLGPALGDQPAACVALPEGDGPPLWGEAEGA